MKWLPEPSMPSCSRQVRAYRSGSAPPPGPGARGPRPVRRWRNRGRPRGCTTCRSASPPTASAPSRPPGSRRSSAYAREHDLVLPRPRPRAAPRACRMRRRARLHPDRAPRPHWLPRRAHERHPRDPRDRPRRRPPRPRGRDRASPARRPRETSATASCRRFATATQASGWRSAATRRSASIRSRRCASSRPARAASGRPGTPCWPRLATSGASSSRTGRGLGLDDAGTSRSTSTTPTCRGRARRTSRSRSRPARRAAWSPARCVESRPRCGRARPPRRPHPRAGSTCRPSRATRTTLAALVRDVLRDAGARDAGDTCVLAGAAERGDRPLVLLAGHLDTVPAQDNRPGRARRPRRPRPRRRRHEGGRGRDGRARAERPRRAGERRRRLRLLRPRGAARRPQRAHAAARARARPALRRRGDRHGADGQRDPRRLPRQHQRRVDVPRHERPLRPPVARRQRDPPRGGRHRRARAGSRTSRASSAACASSRSSRSRASRAGSPAT